ncbi:MAG: glycosyltransferase, partial [Desulfobacterales bacterium]
MKLILYCQHIWGVGHYFRSLEICRALVGDDILMVTGGADVDAPLPDHVRAFRLPALMTDRHYSGLFPTEKGQTLAAVKTERRRLLFELFEREAPDAFVVELYPFGRRAFGFELEPVLEAIRTGRLRRSLVVCSLRDILVEKKDPAVYEKRVVDRLNPWFDALLVHADPALITLDRTFSRLAELTLPIVYTGFITSRPAAGARRRIRRRLNIGADTVLMVASAGGGQTGIVLLQPLLESLAYLDTERPVRLCVFTGPYMPPDEFDRLRGLVDSGVIVERFTPDFMSFLAAADLSVSMGGYNTCMNILASRVPALVWPYPGDREQGLRAGRLEKLGALTVLREKDLLPARLAAIIRRHIDRAKTVVAPIDLEGAARTAKWLRLSVKR